MVRVLSVLFVLVASLSRAAAAPAWDPARTWVVVGGVLRWKDPALEGFSARHRKDKDLFAAFVERGVPASQRVLLLEREATADAFLAALAAQVEAAPRGSTFIVYFQGHGVFDDDGQYVLTTVDADTGQLDRTGLHVAELLPILALRGGADRVILLADACYSGHLGAVADALAFLGVPAVALTSASTGSASSENWTFTQAVIDALSGRPLVDRDGDGRVRLSELAAEAAAAMRYREGQPTGFAAPGEGRGDFDLDLGPAAPWPEDLAALDRDGDVFHRGDWVIARRLDGARGVGRVLGARRDEGKPVRLRLEYYDYTDRAFGWAREDKTDPVMFLSYPVGAELRVEEDEAVWRARVVRVADGLHFVRYEAADGVALIGKAAPDELPEPGWVTPDQILDRLDEATPRPGRVLVEDGGAQYEAVVKGRFHGEVCVRYLGSSFLEDDCVPESRVSPDTRALR